MTREKAFILRNNCECTVQYIKKKDNAFYKNKI
jgi:hypothetical protein